MKRRQITRRIAPEEMPRRAEQLLDGGASAVDRRLAGVGPRWRGTFPRRKEREDGER